MGFNSSDNDDIMITDQENIDKQPRKILTFKEQEKEESGNYRIA